jgi:hypothetical protein
VGHPADIIRTPGSESNVKEIYDACDELARDPENVIFNQFWEFGNHLAHYQATGTVATDSADLYAGERAGRLSRFGGARFDHVAAAAIFGEHLLGAADDHLLELDDIDRNRIFNLGYYTWVEQQGVGLAEFDARRDQRLWRGLRDLLPVWDTMIEEFNARTGVLAAL